MKVVFILFVTAIVMWVGNRAHGVHRHRHARNGQKPERDTGSIILKPGNGKNKLFPGYGTNFRYIGEVKNGLDRVTVVTSIPIPKYQDKQKRQLYLIIVLQTYSDMRQEHRVFPSMKLTKSVIGFWHRLDIIKVNKKSCNLY